MSEIVVTIPDELPLDIIRPRIKEFITEEYLKWKLLEKCVEELNITVSEFDDFEKIREKVWAEKKIFNIRGSSPSLHLIFPDTPLPSSSAISPSYF